MECVKILLLNGANVHAADYQGLTPLHVAAGCGHLACCGVAHTKRR
ncbi:ankyrin repeat domain-containing protein [bacterium]|nr:MAG: ankyrin repeat domain-containing protein [bacterium]